MTAAGGPPSPASGRFADDATFARELAERAGRILLERYERVEEIDYKSPRDVVTEVDHLSEALILGAIRERYPTDGILAEESGAHRGRGSRKAAAPRPTRGGPTPRGRWPRGGRGSWTRSTAP